MVGSLGGFNERGVACDVLSCWSNNETHTGIPLIFRLRMILDHATNVSTALTIINDHRTEGWNAILSDPTSAVAVEQTANASYAGTWDNPVEATKPFWQIPNMVRRTNIFIDPDTAATQRTTYNPRLFPILTTLTGRSKLGWLGVPAYLPWRHYYALSNTLDNDRGNLDLNMSMNVLREVYNGTADPVFHVFVAIGAYCTLHQWVYCPQTGAFCLSLAQGTTNSWKEPIHTFTLQELEDHTP